MEIDKSLTLCHNSDMGTTERRGREKQQRRDDILKTAQTLFFEKGFRDTTIDDIARAAELSRGTIYLYFEGKEEIYATVMEEGLDILYQMISASYCREQDPLANLLAAHDAFMRFHDEQSEFYNGLMLDKMQIADILPPALKARLDAKSLQMAQWLAGILEEGIRQGFFRPMPVQEVAFLQMGMAMGFAQMLDKCGSTLAADKEQTRQTMHNIIAMGVMTRHRAS